MRDFLRILFLLLLAFNKVSGQVSFVEHKIVKGETAYFISQKYKIPLSDIYKFNPEAQNGINDNQILRVPVYASSKEVESENILHIVGAKETLFGFSKQYNVSIETIQNANKETLIDGLKIGQELVIPHQNSPKINRVTSLQQTSEGNTSKITHQVIAKESLFSIARQYNVSVQDLDNLNKDILKLGLQIGQIIAIPNKKKTLDGRARVINGETIFHTVQPKETKYSIAKNYGITIDQLEAQNPEIISGLIEGNKLAINIRQITPTNENEELMIALAEKQVFIEKTKVKAVEVEDLKDRLVVQNEMNQKIIKINDLNLNLNAIGEEKGTMVEKLRLVLEANKNVQEILMSKLDSLVASMSSDLYELKKMDILNLEESKKLEKQSYESIAKTNELSFKLKKELVENRKSYAGLMNKVERIAVEENQEYKKKVRENLKNNTSESIQQRLSSDEIKYYKIGQQKSDEQNASLIAKIDSLDMQKKIEVKRHISKATFYSKEARVFDDKLALLKLKKYQNNVVENKKKSNVEIKEESVSLEEIQQKLIDNPISEDKIVKTEFFDNLKEVKNGYYLVANIFEEAAPRDQFIIKLIDSGDFNSSFFFNVNSLTYYVYSDFFQSLEEVRYAYKQKENNPVFKDMIIVNVEYFTK